MVGGGRAARALRLLLLAVMALAAVEYLFGSILDASSLRTYLYTPYNTTQPTLKSREKSSSSWPKRLPTAEELPTNNTLVVASSTSAPQNKNDSKPNVETTKKAVVAVKKMEASTFTKMLESVRRAMSEDFDNHTNEPELPYCSLPSDLGPIQVNKTDMELEFVETKYPEVMQGGWYKPWNCTGRHKVAIIVPFRDRKQHLASMLNHMHPFLMRQQIEYRIFVIEQRGSRQFNRAKLFNVGFVEGNKLRPGGWECFIFHDVDLLPLDERNLYSCPRQPRHMSASIDKTNFQLMYEGLFGGVSAMTHKQFTDVNGFSNSYWGWGAEDDDMAARLKQLHYHISRYPMSIARYAMLKHQKAKPNPKRYKLLTQTVKNYKKDGLSSLKYELLAVKSHHLYTLITVNIDETS